MKEKFIKELRAALLNNADLETRKSSSRFYKKGEEALVYGVKIGEVTIIAKEFIKQIKSFFQGRYFRCLRRIMEVQVSRRSSNSL